MSALRQEDLAKRPALRQIANTLLAVRFEARKQPLVSTRTTEAAPGPLACETRSESPLRGSGIPSEDLPGPGLIQIIP